MARLKTIVALREGERARLDSVRRLQQRVLEAAGILGGGDLPLEQQSPAALGERLDRWCAELAASSADEGVSDQERRCIAHFVAVTQRLRPHLLECYRVRDIPRTNNDMEGFIRQVKSRYRRISGRKNWNRYLLRYGRRIVYYEPRRAGSTVLAGGPPSSPPVDRAIWQAARAEQRERQQEQLQQYRFRHQRTAFLARLEARWAATSASTEPLP